jgi:MotA/TolQ/ExbB proton channel family
LNEAYNGCRERLDVFSLVMTEIFKHYNNANKTHEESAMGVIDKSARDLLRRINALQMCGNIAPMLGLLGTVPTWSLPLWDGTWARKRPLSSLYPSLKPFTPPPPDS